MNLKKVFHTFLSLVLIITICFFWQELNTIDFGKKINHEKFNSYFASLGAIGTAFSLYLIFQQLNESKKQNRFAFQANLFLENKHFTIKEQGESTLTKPYITITKTEEEELSGEWGIRLINIGNGSALKITAQWLFDKGAVKQITEVSYQDIQIMPTRFQMLPTRLQRDYLRKEEIMFIGLPFLYLNLFGPRQFPEMPTQNKYYVEIPDKPKLSVLVTYTDINHQGFESTFLVETKSNTVNISFDFKHLETKEMNF